MLRVNIQLQQAKDTHSNLPERIAGSNPALVVEVKAKCLGSVLTKGAYSNEKIDELLIHRDFI